MISSRNVFIAVLLGLGRIAGAQVTNTSMTTADAFLCTGSPSYDGGADLSGLNFGAAGTLAIAPASSAKGEFQSVIKFNLSNSVAVFNATYGSNHWSITGVSLDLTSNYGAAGVQPNNPIFNVISGGQFVIEWLADDNWAEGTGTPNLPTTDGVCYSSLPALLAQPHEILGTNTYSPPGNNLHVTWSLPLTVNLVADISGGGEVTFLFHAADSQVGYLFNSYKYGRGNEPLIHVVAIPRLKILSGAFTNGVFHLAGIGGTNATYQIQANADLSTTNWQTMGTATADSEGAIQFDDTGAAHRQQRFYRLSQ